MASSMTESVVHCTPIVIISVEWLIRSVVS